VGADGKTLEITLSGAAAIAVEELTGFGSTGSAVLNLLDYINIASNFVSDPAGNPGTGSASNLVVLGAQNEGSMPHVFSADLTVDSNIVDETLGEGVGSNADLSNSVLTLAGDATSVSVQNAGAGDFGIYGQTVFGGPFAEVVSGSGVIGDLDGEIVFADGSILRENTDASDTLSGTVKGDQLRAGTNGDRLLGNAGDDLLIGGAGSDAIYGGSGADIIYGGGGNDYLSGGSGIDTFIYSDGANDGHDVIVGFNVADDVINVDGGANAATLLALAVQSGADTIITLGTDTIRLLGVSAAALAAGNFSNANAFISGADLT
jgi:Ca2+-binding RTX toxin-like protein